jgi:hypothetical protein
MVERVLPAYYASMLRDKNLQQPASQKLNGSDVPKKEKPKNLLGGCEDGVPLRLRARLQVEADNLYGVWCIGK